MKVFTGEASKQVLKCVGECQDMGEDVDGDFYDVIKRSEMNQHKSDYRATVVLDDEIFDSQAKIRVFVTVPGLINPFIKEQKTTFSKRQV
jgi:hypothetical protein